MWPFSPEPWNVDAVLEHSPEFLRWLSNSVSLFAFESRSPVSQTHYVAKEPDPAISTSQVPLL